MKAHQGDHRISVRNALLDQPARSLLQLVAEKLLLAIEHRRHSRHRQSDQPVNYFLDLFGPLPGTRRIRRHYARHGFVGHFPSRIAAMLSTMLISAGRLVFSGFAGRFHRTSLIFVRTSLTLSSIVNRPLSAKYLSTAPIFPRKTLYTGTPNAAASRFIVPPPLTTKSENHIRFKPSTGVSGIIKWPLAINSAHCFRNSAPCFPFRGSATARVFGVSASIRKVSANNSSASGL